MARCALADSELDLLPLQCSGYNTSFVFLRNDH